MRALLLAALITAAVPAAAACPNAGLATTPVTFVTKNGRHKYAVEVAASDAEQECGLMFREKLPGGTGMIFPMAVPRQASFWMKNTQLPLDLVFVGPDHRVVSVGKGVPFSRDLIDSGGITASVIELNAGEAARIGLQPGDRVEGGVAGR